MYLQGLEELVVQALNERGNVAPHARLAARCWLLCGLIFATRVAFVHDDVRVLLQDLDDLQQGCHTPASHQMELPISSYARPVIQICLSRVADSCQVLKTDCSKLICSLSWNEGTVSFRWQNLCQGTGGGQVCCEFVS